METFVAGQEALKTLYREKPTANKFIDHSNKYIADAGGIQV